MSDRARTEAGGTSSIGVDTDSANQGQHLQQTYDQHVTQVFTTTEYAGRV